MAEIPRLFISHAWHGEDLYDQLVTLLNIVFTHWTNLSIPRDRCLKLVGQGESGYREELSMQETLLGAIRRRRALIEGDLAAAELRERELEEEMARLDSELAPACARIDRAKARLEPDPELSIIRARLGRCNARIAELVERRVGERLLDSERTYRDQLAAELDRRTAEDARRRERMLTESRRELEESYRALEGIRRATQPRRDSLNAELDRITSRIVGLRSNRRAKLATYEEITCSRIKDLRIDAVPLKYNRFERPRVLPMTVVGRLDVARRNPSLALAIYQRIVEADAFLLITGVYDQYRSWREFESMAASDVAVPIVAIVPSGHEGVPRELGYRVWKTVPWSVDSLRSVFSSGIPPRPNKPMQRPAFGRR